MVSEHIIPFTITDSNLHPQATCLEASKLHLRIDPDLAREGDPVGSISLNQDKAELLLK